MKKRSLKFGKLKKNLFFGKPLVVSIVTICSRFFITFQTNEVYFGSRKFILSSDNLLSCKICCQGP